jgi:soluble lytic murein transglycosylase
MSRRALVATAWVLGAVMIGALVVSQINNATRRFGLPLSNAAVIRTQASAKHLDPALIAAVIYAETKFDPRPSAAGAQGLMQILPKTAYFIARRSGGTRFQASDLATPSVNVAYGSYYLRYLLDHYAGNEMLAIAAYNAGLSNVDRWVAAARTNGQPLSDAAIPFPETREYVQRVLTAELDYRVAYRRELGLG